MLNIQIKTIDINYVNIFTNGRRIEIVEIDDKDSSIKNLGVISNKEYYDFLKNKSDKFIIKNKISDEEIIPEKTATEEDIDDWCSHMDKVLQKD